MRKDVEHEHTKVSKQRKAVLLGWVWGRIKREGRPGKTGGSRKKSAACS